MSTIPPHLVIPSLTFHLVIPSIPPHLVIPSLTFHLVIPSIPPHLVIPSVVEGSLDKGNALKGDVHFF